MIKLKYILLENNYKKQLTLDAAVEIFKVNNKTYTDFRKSIYRGTNAIEPYYFIRPSQGGRMSAYTSNYYTLIIDNSPEWQAYPKRSKSIICTTDSNYAKNYSESGLEYYFVFPKDGSKIGVCPHGDIWRSFQKSLFGFELNDFNYCIELLADEYKKNSNDEDKVFNYNNFEVDYNALAVLFNYVTENKDYLMTKFETEHGAPNTIMMYWGEHENNTFNEYVNSLITPTTNKFKITIYDSNFNLEPGHEVWTDGDSLLIHKDEIRKFKKAVGIF